MKKDKIDNLRNKINNLDDEILNLLDERSLVVNEIGKLKDQSKSVIDKNREQEILDRLLNNLKGNYSKDSIVRIWRELFYASSKIQMDSNSKILSKREIENLKIYKGGKSSVEGKNNIIKLSSNENALEPSSNVYKIMNQKILHRYGEINGKTLRSQLAKLHSINADQIILGNGSNEILLMTALAFCHPGDEIVHSEYGFEMYPIISKIVGAVSKIAKVQDYKINIDSIIENISDSTKVVFIDNPNNPTGTYLNKNDLKELLIKIPKNIVVVIDGAYSEYVENEDYDKGFELINKHENLIITRTFSKVYGLAGIRLGWCYTSPKIANILNKVKPPFNANVIALEMATEALNDVEHLKKTIKENSENRRWFENELKKLNIKCLISSSNFIFIECEQQSDMANRIYNLLLNNGIIVRQLNSYGLSNCLRITIGTKEQMEKTVKTLIQGNLS